MAVRNLIVVETEIGGLISVGYTNIEALALGLTGGTLTGPLSGTSISATTISANAYVSGGTNIIEFFGNGTNIGSGEGIYSGKSGTTSIFKTINTIGSDIVISSTTNEIKVDLNADLSNLVNTITRWNSGLEITEQAVPDDTVLHTSGDYFVNGVKFEITTGGTFDLSSIFAATSSGERVVVGIYVDVDEVIKAVSGDTITGANKAINPTLPTDSVCLAFILIDDNKAIVTTEEIDDCRSNLGSASFGTDEFVKISDNDTTTKHLEDALSAGTNITFTVLNEGGNEKILISAAGSTGATLTVQSVTADTNTTTTVSSYPNLMSGMSITGLTAGDYLVSFGTSFSHSSNNDEIDYTIFVGGVEIIASGMNWSRGAGQGDITTPVGYSNYPITLSSTNSIEIHWLENAGGTATAQNRYLTIIKAN